MVLIFGRYRIVAIGFIDMDEFPREGERALIYEKQAQFGRP